MTDGVVSFSEKDTGRKSDRATKNDWTCNTVYVLGINCLRLRATLCALNVPG